MIGCLGTLASGASRCIKSVKRLNSRVQQAEQNVWRPPTPSDSTRHSSSAFSSGRGNRPHSEQTTVKRSALWSASRGAYEKATTGERLRLVAVCDDSALQSDRSEIITDMID